MHRWYGVVVVLAAVLAVASPATAKERGPRPIVPVASSGEGIAPRAPEWVRQQVERIHAGAIESGDAESAERSLQSVRRASWIGCRDVWAYRGYDHFIGYNLFRYYQQVSWCSNGFTIYSWSRFRWPELNGPGWGFDGHIGSYLGGSSVAKRAWTQGAFHTCIAGWCDHKVPWVNIEVNVDGGWSANSGG
ncbi:MAG: hypothetical protein ACXWZ1_12075 [Gaiellaceae bacterium]